MKGTHTPEDDILMHKKAHAIVNCYIDSAVTPRVQVASLNLATSVKTLADNFCAFFCKRQRRSTFLKSW